MIFHDIEQNTDEWQQFRCGKLTSSSLGKVMAKYGGAFGDPAKQYAIEIAIQQITGKQSSGGYSNEHMQRGHEEEPLARMAYENEYFCDVNNGGFFDLGNIGCSPDGLVGEDGVIEIKSVIAATHYKNVKRRGFDPTYKWQLAGNLKFTQREWIDFVSYSSSYPEGKQLFVFRSDADSFKEEFKMIDSRVGQFLELVEEYKSNILRG